MHQTLKTLNMNSIEYLVIFEKKLQDVDAFLSAGQKGAVLFSMGTNIHSKNLGLEKQTAILEAFRRLPEYNFLWKFEDKNFPLELPSNVMIRSWTSQNDVLNHPNVRCFVTHGGGLSTYETSWYGVPIIGIPFLADQHRVNQFLNGGRIHFQIINLLSSKIEHPQGSESRCCRTNLFP